MSAPAERGRVLARRRTWFVAVGALLAVALVLTWFASRGSAEPGSIGHEVTAGDERGSAREPGDDEPQASSDDEPHTSPADETLPDTPAPVTDAPPELESAAEDAVSAALSVIVDNDTPELSLDVSDELAQTVGGAMQAEIEALLLELEANEWTQRGTPTIEDVRVVSADDPESPKALTVEACVDSSNVVYLRADGSEVPSSSTPRATNIFTLSLEDGVWRAVSRTFPDDPAC